MQRSGKVKVVVNGYCLKEKVRERNEGGRKETGRRFCGMGSLMDIGKLLNVGP